MKIEKKHLWIFMIIVALIMLPLFINVCYLWKTDYSILFAPSGWATFWATYISAIASFVMVFITWRTLKQNKQQLDELKRQWNAEHTPYLSCQLIADNSYFKLRVFNSSNVAATNVAISINNCLKDKDVFRFSELKTFLTNQLFVIPPNESLYFDIFITAYRDEENLPAGYIEVKLNTPTIDFGTFNLYPRNFAFVVNGDRERPIANAILKVADNIHNQEFRLK